MQQLASGKVLRKHKESYDSKVNYNRQLRRPFKKVDPKLGQEKKLTFAGLLLSRLL